MAAHSRTKDFAFRQMPLLTVLLVPLAVGLAVGFLLLAANLLELLD